ncbi:hypothetical protein R6Z07F_003683 [Ovis aries]
MKERGRKGLESWHVLGAMCSVKKETQVHPWIRKMPWRREWLPTPVFSPGESHGQRSWWATVYGVTSSWTGLSDQTRTSVLCGQDPCFQPSAQPSSPDPQCCLHQGALLACSNADRNPLGQLHGASWSSHSALAGEVHPPRPESTNRGPVSGNSADQTGRAFWVLTRRLL